MDVETIEAAVRRAVREELAKLLPEAIRRVQRRLIDARELASQLGVSVRTIRSWQARGLIPYIRVGRRILFNPDEVEAALKERVVSRVGYFNEET